MVFDGSYWRDTKSSTKAADFTTKLYGNATLSYGTLEIKNGAIFDVSGSYTQAADATLGVQVNAKSPAHAIKAGSAALAGTLNILDYDGITTPVTIIETTSGVSGTFTTVNIAGGTGVDFMSVAMDYTANSSKRVTATMGLTWNKTDGTQHGDFTLSGASDSFTLSAALADKTGAGSWDGKSLTKKGAGTLILTGANTYTGATTISGGQITGGAADVLKTSSGVTLSNSAKFATGNFNQEVKNLVGGASNAVITGSAATHILTLNNTSDTTFAGAISGAGSITKTGSNKLTLSGANTYTGKTTISGGTLEIGNGGSLSVVADKESANAPIVNGGAFTVNGSLVVDANATQLGVLVAGTKTPFYFADTKTGLTVGANELAIHSNINTQLYTVDDYVTNDSFIVITKKGGEIHYVSSSVGAAFASYTPNGGNAIFDDVHTNTLGEYNDAERVEMSYNAASHVGAAQQGAAALSGVYGVMDGVFAGNFEHGGGGVYRGQVCDPCAPADGRSRLERAVWVMPIYGHQSAAGLHSGDVRYGYTSDQYAAVFGTEVKSGKTRFGIAGNVGIGRAVSPGAVVHTNSDLTYGGVSLYATQKFGKVESNAQVGWIGTRNEMRQNNAGVRVNADIDGGVIYAAVGFERPYHVGHLTLAPIFGLEFTHLYQNSFATKADGTAIFNAQSGNANMLHLPLGLKAIANYKTRFGQFSPMVKARALPHVGDRELAFTNLSTGSTTAATLHGIVSDAVAGDVTFGSTLKRGHTEIGGAYTLLFSEHFTNQNVSVLVKRKF